MENKNRFYNALKKNKGRINEIDLGEKMGLDEDETRAVIAQLLSEHRIDYVENIACSYRVTKSESKKYKAS